MIETLTPWPESLPEAWLNQLSQDFSRDFLQPELLHQAENASWLLPDLQGQVWIFKLYRPTPAGLSRLEQEIQLLSGLKKQGFRAPDYLQDCQGQILQHFEGFYATLQPALQGLMWIRPKPSAYEALGKCLRQLHALSPQLRDIRLRVHDFDTLLGDTAWQAVLDAPFAPAELKAELSSWREQLRAEFEFSTHCLVHCDAHWGNVIVTEDGVCLIDWEEAGWGNHLLDLATVEIHLQTSPQREEAVAALHRGYGLALDRRQLNLAMALRRMWLLSQIPARLDIPELSDPLSVFRRYQRHFQELLGPASVRKVRR